MTNKTWQELFWAKVQKTKGEDTCWPWLGFKDKNGYGMFGNKHSWSRSYKTTQEVAAHRVSWVLHTGIHIPRGIWILHVCDNPPCVRPSHLFQGDNVINSQDRDSKGRRYLMRGEGCWQTPLTENDVKSIRRLNISGVSQTQLARDFGVGQSSISEIVHRKTWRHI